MWVGPFQTQRSRIPRFTRVKSSLPYLAPKLIPPSERRTGVNARAGSLKGSSGRLRDSRTSGSVFTQPVEQTFEGHLLYRVLQLNFAPEMPFERCQTNVRKRSFKQHIKYFNFRSKIQLEYPVCWIKLLGSLLSSARGFQWHDLQVFAFWLGKEINMWMCKRNYEKGLSARRIRFFGKQEKPFKKCPREVEVFCNMGSTLVWARYTAARVCVQRLIVLPAYLFNFKVVPNQGLIYKSACLIVQSLNARVYVHLLADKTAGRIRGRLCSYNSKAQWLSDCLMQVQGISACVINVTVVLYPRYTIFFHLWIAYQRSHSERLNES